MAIRFERKTEEGKPATKKAAGNPAKPADPPPSDTEEAPSSELPFGKPVKADKKRKGR